MPPEPWCCAACGRARAEVERARADAGHASLPPEAMACGQRCALALVEREIASAEEVEREIASAEEVEREIASAEEIVRGPAPSPVRVREDRVYVPGRATYVRVVQLEPRSAGE